VILPLLEPGLPVLQPAHLAVWALWMVGGLGFVAAGSGVNRPPTFGLISINTSADEQGATLGVAQSAGSLARIIAPVAANLLYRYRPALPYYVCAAIALLTAVVAWVALCRKPAGPTPKP
jgi:MFS transporter, DHA1 family, tetracycline resistance protein